MEWVWEGVSPVLVNRDQYSAATVQAVEEHARSIIRKIALADLLKSKNTSYVKRVKDYIDLSLMQQFVVEEVLRHFSTNNRLDLMNQEDATNVIRNLNTLLIGIEESIYPFPNHLVLEVVHALKVITVNTNSWVRSRIKNDTKLLVIRDKLAFSLLTDIYNILSDRPQYLDKIVEANMHDPNSSLVLLKSIVLAVEEKSCENIEALLGMLKTLIKLEPDHRIYMTKCFSDRGLCALFMSPTLSGDVLAQWCVENDAEWKAAAALIMSRCAKKIESDITMRAERRDKEIASKRKLRKAEIEKKHALQRKMVSDFDKVMQDISAQRKKYDEVMNRVAVKRSERDAERSRRDATGTAAEAQQPPMFVHEQPMSPLTDNLHDEIVSTIPLQESNLRNT